MARAGRRGGKWNRPSLDSARSVPSRQRKGKVRDAQEDALLTGIPISTIRSGRNDWVSRQVQVGCNLDLHGIAVPLLGDAQLRPLAPLYRARRGSS